MLTSNVFSGVGCTRDEALRGGARQNLKQFNDGVARERVMMPLGLDAEHRDLVKGDLCSIQGGCIVPLADGLPFGGIIDAIGEERGRYVCSVWTRGAMCIHVSGLLKETRMGAPIYALRRDGRETFSLDGQGIAIGEILAVENMERGMGIVGFKRADDANRFELGGNRPR